MILSAFVRASSPQVKPLFAALIEPAEVLIHQFTVR